MHISYFTVALAYKTAKDCINFAIPILQFTDNMLPLTDFLFLDCQVHLTFITSLNN